MVNFFGSLFDTSDFPARWHCGNWTDAHGWVHIISDTAIFGAYTAIPLVLAYFLLRKGDVSFPTIGWLFCIFILACGTTHLVEAGIFWWPAYRFSALMKILTATVSWLTVFALIRFAPMAIELPGLAALNSALQSEIDRRVEVESELIRHKEALQQLVEERTKELVQANDSLEKRAIELERSNEALNEFAYIASHDLQEPLRKIRTFGTRLVKSAGNDLNAQATDDLSRITNAATRMQAMIDGLLDYSRASTQVRLRDEVDLNAVLAEVLETLETRVEQTNATVDRNDLPAVCADRLQMVQLFQNLVGNALKFVRPGTDAHVSVASAMTDDSMVQITVADNGIGIDPDHTQRLFQPFSRLNPRGEYEGSGIGLSICRKIVERHGGHISVHGVPGEGTTFTITLPLKGNGPEDSGAAPA